MPNLGQQALQSQFGGDPGNSFKDRLKVNLAISLSRIARPADSVLILQCKVLIPQEVLGIGHGECFLQHQ